MRFLFFILAPTLLWSQSASFSYVYPLPDTQAVQSSFWVENDNSLYNVHNVFCYGQSNPFEILEPGLTFMKTAQNGAVLWKNHVNNRSDAKEWFYQMLSKKPLMYLNNKIIGAALYRDDNFNQHTTVWGFDELGMLQWQFTPTSNSAFFAGEQLCKAPDGNHFYLMGIKYDGANSQTIVGYRLTDAGQLTDSLLISIPGFSNNFVYTVTDATLSDSHLTIALKYVSLSGSASARLLLRCTPSGQVLWHKTYNNPYSWEMLPSPNVVHVNQVSVANNLSSVNQCHQLLNAEGEQQLNECQQYSTSTDTTIVQVQQILPHPNGADYYLVGIEFGVEPTDLTRNFIERHTEDGTLVWRKIYLNSDAVPTGFIDGSTIAADGSLLISGSGYQENSAVPPYGKSVLWLLKVDENGCFNNNCSDTIVVSSQIVSPATTVLDHPLIQIFPNPANEWLHIAMPENEFYTVEIYNALGVLVYRDKTTNSSKSIHIGNWENGMYSASIRLKNKLESPITKRIIVNH